MLDARRRGVPTEAYKQHAARRNDRPSSVASYCGGWKGNTADDTLMVDQGVTFPLDPRGRFFYTSASKLEKHLETDGF